MAEDLLGFVALSAAFGAVVGTAWWLLGLSLEPRAPVRLLDNLVGGAFSAAAGALWLAWISGSLRGPRRLPS